MKWVFILVCGDPKYEESVKISQAPKSLFPSVIYGNNDVGPVPDTPDPHVGHPAKHETGKSLLDMDINFTVVVLLRILLASPPPPMPRYLRAHPYPCGRTTHNFGRRHPS